MDMIDQNRENRFKILFLLAIAFIALSFLSVFCGHGRAEASAQTNVRTVESFFSSDEGVTITNNVNTPDYVAVLRNGVFVESPNAKKVVYENLIDVSALTKNNILLELQITPKVSGEPELDRFIVRLEDSENPKCFVNVSLYRYQYNDNAKNRVVHILAQPSTVEAYYGWYYEKNAISNNLQHGTMVEGPFGGNVRGSSCSISLFYDETEKAVYVKSDSEHADKNGRLLVVDMDDPTFMGADKTALFGGFPSGKIKLSIITNNVFKESAGYMILTVDGQTMDGQKLNDITPPNLAIDLQGYDENELPKAQVGKFYSFFPAVSTDKMYGKLPVAVRVINDGEDIYSLANGFVPYLAGEYTIEYSSTDGNYNKAKKELKIIATDSLNPITGTLVVRDGDYDFNDDGLKDENGYYAMNLYFSVRLPEMRVSGGSGKIVTKLSVSVNGKEVSVRDSVFVPIIGGIYNIRYIMTDYIDNTEVVEYTAKIAYSDMPRIVEPILPDYVSVDEEISLPKAEVEYFTVWNQHVQTYDTITIYRIDGETKLYEFDGSKQVTYRPSVTDGESIVVEYASAKTKGEKKSVFRKTVRILPSERISDRFVASDGVTVTESSLSLSFSFTDDTQSVKFINPIAVFNGAKIVFTVPANDGQNSYDEVWFTFIDSTDKNIKETVRFYKNRDSNSRVSYVSADGVNKVEFPASFYGNVIDKFNFTIYKTGEVRNVNNDVVATLSDFKGFTSGFVYVEFGVTGSTGERDTAVVSLAQICNQILGDIEADFIKPLIFVERDPVGMAELNSYVEIPGAYANDVYNVKVKLSLEVSFKDKIVYAEENEFGRVKGTKLFAYDYGTYRLTYMVTDSSGNSITKKFTIRIRDNVEPTIIVDGDVPEKVSRNVKLSLPQAYALDNVDVNLTIYAIIINPMNVYDVIEIGEKYEVTIKGRYIVKFYCEDSCYNAAYSKEYYFLCE